MTKIKWNLPGPDETGYLRRRRDAIALLDAEPSPENMEALFQFLLPFVEEPKGNEAVEALLDLSKAEYGRIILGFLGYEYNVSDPKDEKSVAP